ncbi:RNA-editing complex protein [Trypanosoma grayi]|uniref:RNA-editing complex protein n=1 Tax=Trypanosoma grayi TaxID=71804 RepID=UPI0004F3F247|nr:RNA-editing complex protein [Trypanosoma grayi]KEG08821.1 RNA-editing complex protein [Trypanosoma grayi]
MFFSTLKRMPIRPLNRVTLLGALHDVQTGFLDQSSVFQFVLTCSFLDLQAATDAKKPAAVNPSVSVALGVAAGEQQKQQAAKEQYTVRCLGDEAYTDALRGALEEGCIVQVVGRLKTIETMDGSKKQLFPFIIVEQGRWSNVSLIHSPRKQRRDWQLQSALAVATPPR